MKCLRKFVSLVAIGAIGSVPCWASAATTSRAGPHRRGRRFPQPRRRRRPRPRAGSRENQEGEKEKTRHDGRGKRFDDRGGVNPPVK